VKEEGAHGTISKETRRTYRFPQQKRICDPTRTDDAGLPTDGARIREGLGDREVSGEKQCLRFVLDDLGWNGYLGFIEDPPGSQTLHIGCSPSSRPFFTQVFEDVQAQQP
jgi:hypothetical protein